MTQKSEVDIASKVLYDSGETISMWNFLKIIRITAFAAVLLLFFFFFMIFVSPSGSRGERRVVQFSATYFFCCFIGGIVSGLPHTFMTPIDLVKCRMQVGEYESMSEGFKSIYQDSGRSFLNSLPFFFRGWVPTFIGYSLQGGIKFFFYELFKFLLMSHQKSSVVGQTQTEVRLYTYQIVTYLFASFLAELIADIALAPWEAVKIKIQTTSVHRTQINVIIPMVWAAEGCRGFYKGLTALWCRQVPYTVVKFSSFESITEILYKVLVTTPRSATPKSVQLIISVLAGIIAGTLCAIVSHPADTIVSKLNQRADTLHSSAKNNFCQLMRDIGWNGLWKGIGPRILMVGTLTAMQWLLYDSFKVLVGLPTTGGGIASAKTNLTPVTVRQ